MLFLPKPQPFLPHKERSVCAGLKRRDQGGLLTLLCHQAGLNCLHVVLEWQHLGLSAQHVVFQALLRPATEACTACTAMVPQGCLTSAACRTTGQPTCAHAGAQTGSEKHGHRLWGLSREATCTVMSKVTLSRGLPCPPLMRSQHTGIHTYTVRDTAGWQSAPSCPRMAFSRGLPCSSVRGRPSWSQAKASSVGVWCCTISAHKGTTARGVGSSSTAFRISGPARGTVGGTRCLARAVAGRWGTRAAAVHGLHAKGSAGHSRLYTLRLQADELPAQLERIDAQEQQRWVNLQAKGLLVCKTVHQENADARGAHMP